MGKAFSHVAASANVCMSDELRRRWWALPLIRSIELTEQGDVGLPLRSGKRRGSGGSSNVVREVLRGFPTRRGVPTQTYGYADEWLCGRVPVQTYAYTEVQLYLLSPERANLVNRNSHSGADTC